MFENQSDWLQWISEIQAIAQSGIKYSHNEFDKQRYYRPLWDKQKHDHPPQWPHVYKCFFHCEILSGNFEENLEISELDFFDWDDITSLIHTSGYFKSIE